MLHDGKYPEVFPQPAHHCSRTSVAPLKVLVIEDDFGDFDAVARALRKMEDFEVEIVRAKTTEEARYEATKTSFDVAFVDYHLGADSGVRFLKENGGRVGATVTILLTGKRGRDVHDAALKAGALSCINKDDLSPTLLETTLRYAVHTHRVEQQLYEMMARAATASHSTLATKPTDLSKLSDITNGPLDQITLLANKIMELSGETPLLKEFRSHAVQVTSLAAELKERIAETKC